MSDHTVPAMDAFEESLGQGLRALGDEALRHADPLAVTRAAATAAPRRLPWSVPDAWGLRRPNGRATAVLGTTLIVLGAVVGTLLLAGVRPTPPSLDGRLVYSRDGDIYVASADGSDPIRIADGIGITYERPRWLPGGGSLSATATFPYERDPGLVVFDASGAMPRMVGDVGSLETESTGAFIQGLHGLPGQPWAPDGRRWARIGDGTLDIVDDDGSVTYLQMPPGYARWDDSDLASIAWAPDGSGVFAAACTTKPCFRGAVEADGDEHDLFFVPLDGRPAVSLASRGDPAWRAIPSPDGSHLAFIGAVSDDSGYRWDSMYLAVQGVDGSRQRTLRSGLSMPAATAAMLYAWSPDSMHLAFSVPTTAADDAGLWVADLGGEAAPRRLQGGDWTAWGWSADGRRILAGQSDDQTSSLWSVDPGDGKAVKLVDGASSGDWEGLPRGATERTPSVSPVPTRAPDRSDPSGIADGFTRPFAYTVPSGSTLQPAYETGDPHAGIMAFVDGHPRTPDPSDSAYAYGGQDDRGAMPRGIAFGSGDRAWTHGPGGRMWLRPTPAELLDDLRSKALIALGEIEATTIDGRPAFAVDMPARGDNDIHFSGGLGGLASTTGYVRLGLPSRLFVVDVNGSTVVVQVWARSHAGLEAWLPIASEFIDSIHFVDGT